MKRMALMITVVALVLWAVGNAPAAPINPGGINIIITFDENGNGYTDYPSVGTHLTSGFDSPEDNEYDGPIPAPATLYYVLPGQGETGWGGVMEGDVVVTEPDGTISDVLRFVSSTNRVYVYSDLGSDPADVGIPSVLWTDSSVFVPEEGTELGWNGIHYTPIANGEAQPGFLSTTIPWTEAPWFSYVFTSDVPEPATMSLLALGGLVSLRRRCP